MLKHLWDRIVHGRRTVSEVASDFSYQFSVVKLILFRWFAAEFAKSAVTGPVPDAPDTVVSGMYKLIRYQSIAAEFAKSGVTGPVPDAPDSDVSGVFAAEVVNHLMGHLFDPFNERVSERVRIFALQIGEDIPQVADNLMKQDENLRELVVYTLRMRLILGSVQNPKFAGTQEGKRIGLLLQLYGGEFQEEVDELRYTALVNKWIAWAESPEFPGRRFQ